MLSLSWFVYNKFVFLDYLAIVTLLLMAIFICVTAGFHQTMVSIGCPDLRAKLCCYRLIHLDPYYVYM